MTAKYYDFGDLWTSLALAGFVITFITGIAYLGPQDGKLLEQLERGVPEQALAPRFSTYFTVARLDLLLLFAIIVIMVIKPT